MMPSGRANSFRVAVVGASSLRGKELVQVLEESRFPASDIVLIDTSVPAGTLTEAGGEPTFIRPLSEESFEGARFAFFAGTAQDAEQNWSVAQRTGATVIDLTGALAGPRHAAGASARIPSLSSALSPLSSSPEKTAPQPPVFSSPAPGVIFACTLAAGMRDFAPQPFSVLVFPPVSEREQAGVEELESQTAAILTFREIAKPVFDAQVAFNLLASYGARAKPSLADTRRAMARDVAAYLAGRTPVPAIQILQAPVFYGYAFAAYAEFRLPVAAEQLEAAFANLGVKIAGALDDPPSNASVAGDSQIHLARMEADPNVPSGVWLWGAADGLRLGATNAVRIAEEMIGKSGE
jgi:aspartate-semialdehyde dehydrogenase